MIFTDGYCDIDQPRRHEDAKAARICQIARLLEYNYDAGGPVGTNAGRGPILNTQC